VERFAETGEMKPGNPDKLSPHEMFKTTQELVRFGNRTEKMENWRVLLAEGHLSFRQEMVKVLAGMREVNLVAKVANGWDVMFTSAQLKPDIILLDFDLPGLTGPEVTSLIKRGLPDTPVIMMLSGEDEGQMKLAAQCGASACLVKSLLAQDLPPLLEKLERGRRVSEGQD